MRRITVIGLVIIAIALSAVLYPRLPDRMPTHWNAAGQVNGESSRAMGMFLIPLAMLGTFRQSAE
jgi:uncharacterized membrane protein